MPDPAGAKHRTAALYVLCTGMLMIVLDATIANVALPTSNETCASPPEAWPG